MLVIYFLYKLEMNYFLSYGLLLWIFSNSSGIMDSYKFQNSQLQSNSSIVQMQKELQKTLSQTPMYSKMGRYISNKVIKYNKSSASPEQISKVLSPPPYQYLNEKSMKTNHESSKVLKTTFSTQKNRFGKEGKEQPFMERPPLGYYNVNYCYTDKNVHQYNFNRSIPHFHKQKYFCNQSESVCKDYPDISTSKGKIKCLIQMSKSSFKRFDNNASIRKFEEDPHENRFQLINSQTLQNKREKLTFERQLKRSQMFKNIQNISDYTFDHEITKKRLDVLGIPFEKQLQRNTAEHFEEQPGVSSSFHSCKKKKFTKQRMIPWKKNLGRQKIGILPSYMDKNIHTRMNLAQVSIKSLEMSCCDYKSKSKLGEKFQPYIREEEKQNM